MFYLLPLQLCNVFVLVFVSTALPVRMISASVYVGSKNTENEAKGRSSVKTSPKKFSKLKDKLLRIP